MCPLGHSYLISQMRKQLPLKRSSPVQGPSVTPEPVGICHRLAQDAHPKKRVVGEGALRAVSLNIGLAIYQLCG